MDAALRRAVRALLDQLDRDAASGLIAHETLILISLARQALIRAEGQSS